MGIVGQDSWGGGMFRGRRAPDDAAYDIVGLIDDERQPYRRGGTTFKTNTNVGTSSLTGLVDAELAAGRRTFFWNGVANFVLAANDATPLTLFTNQQFVDGARAVVIGGMLVGPVVTPAPQALQVGAYGGSRITAADVYSTGTASVTTGSNVVTGAGTAWVANADAGMIFRPVGAATSHFYLVKSIDSDTQLTLRTPITDVTGASLAYRLWPSTDANVVSSASYTDPSAMRVVGSAGGRLLAAWGTRVYFSAPDDPLSLGAVADPTSYHEIPAKVTGIEGIGTTALIFTLTGVWAIENLELDAFDDVGNLQHTIEQFSRDVILWGEAGLAGYAGAAIVPAVDNVYVMTATGQVTPIGDSIGPLYRSYVKAGYTPGFAAVYRGHYILPIITNFTSTFTVVDVLVCRLDRGYAWSRWTGHAAALGYAQRIASALGRSPALIGINGLRLIDASNCFDPSAVSKLDADGTAPPWEVVTRDYDLGAAIRKHTVLKLRAEYELVDAAADNPTLTAAVTVDARETGATFTNLTGSAPETTGASSPVSWAVARKGERARFRLTANGASADLRLKRIEAHVREAGF
jgi:hypothetical protein